ncbi:2-isopropylmalate synthase [Myxococcota bacterium]|nr:2-isopropylmalate synthase [Myxococcota bacterium]
MYDWNRDGSKGRVFKYPFELLDETLRDGIQSPSVTDPSVEDKLQLIHIMNELGIGMVDLGLPNAGPRSRDAVLALARGISDARLPIKTCCAARTRAEDVRPVVDTVQATGLPIEVYVFVGSSPVRLFAEDWTVNDLLAHVREAVTFARKEGLVVNLVTEDTTRARPEVLRALYTEAVELGASRLCLTDTVGHATPDGVQRLFAWVRLLLEEIGAQDVGLDWHGHNDRGMAVANSLVAIEAGAGRVHGTALGIGERVGNAALDQILVNLKLEGAWKGSLSRLMDYCEKTAEACDIQIPPNYPVVGRDAFRTGSGVHAAAIVKALERGDQDLVDRVYSCVPANWLGRQQEIEISHMSGMSNVVYWLKKREIEYDPALATVIFNAAKNGRRTLRENEILKIIQEYQHKV